MAYKIYGHSQFTFFFFSFNFVVSLYGDFALELDYFYYFYFKVSFICKTAVRRCRFPYCPGNTLLRHNSCDNLSNYIYILLVFAFLCIFMCFLLVRLFFFLREIKWAKYNNKKRNEKKRKLTSKLNRKWKRISAIKLRVLRSRARFCALASHACMCVCMYCIVTLANQIGF